MTFFALPIITRTLRPGIVGTPVWNPASSAATTHDVTQTVASGSSRKLIRTWVSDGGELPLSAVFDPAGAAIPLLAIDAAFGELGDLRCAAWYLDTPPTGSKVTRITTSGSVWSAGGTFVFENAQAGVPEANATISADSSLLSTLGRSIGADGVLLLDAYSITLATAIAEGLTDGDLTAFNAAMQATVDDEVNSAFLSAYSLLNHKTSGLTQIGWTAAGDTNMLMPVVNIVHSSGQTVVEAFMELSSWSFNETGLLFSDEYGLSDVSATSGVSGGQSPLFSGGGTSVRTQDVVAVAAHAPPWQQRSYTVGGYGQLSSWPVSGVRPLLGKDSGLPVPGGFQVEIETTGALDAYIRNSTGLAGTAVHVTGDSGSGEIPLDTAFLWALAYDDVLKTASVYLWLDGGSPAVLATKTDANFSGLENNTAALSVFCRSGSPGAGQDGVLSRTFFGAGAMSLAEFSALPEPTSISDPDAPSDIVMQDISLGIVTGGVNIDIAPPSHGTGFGDPVGDLTFVEVEDDDGVMTFLADGGGGAKIRITPPAQTTSHQPFEAIATVSEDGGLPSNPFRMSGAVAASEGGGGYTSFPFVTAKMPPISHAGVSARPGHSPTDPQSASFIDPMSGLEVFRLTPNRGANIVINGSTDTGLNMPAHLKGNNNVHADRCWNADGTLLMLTDSKTRSSDPSNPCRSALIDVDGNHGNSAPWRFLRAAGQGGLGDAGVTTTNFMWDPANPLRAYVFKADGMYEWWPAGGDGHSVGEQSKLYGWPAGFTGMNIPQDHPCQASYDGAFWCVPCRRTSDGKRGGLRINLATGAVNAFRAHPLAGAADDNANDIAGTSPNGIDGYFNRTLGTDVKYTRRVNMITGAMSPQHTAAQRLGEHPELFTRNGETHLLGGGNGNWGALRYSDLTMFNMGDASGVSVSHVSCRAYKDLWETIGGGTATSGLRYAMVVITSPADQAGIRGLRLDFGDNSQWRYLCHHRSLRNENANEVHPMPDPYFSKVYFNSNWVRGGVETDTAHINMYICLVPDAWKSHNNDGS